MRIRFTPYNIDRDYHRVSQFLVSSFRPLPGGVYQNWLQPRWEYMHYHPLFNAQEAWRCGLWEVNGNIVALANYEMNVGQAFFAWHPNFAHLKREMLLYAEDVLRKEVEPGKAKLAAWINDFDSEFEAIARELGYTKDEKYPEFWDITMFSAQQPLPEIVLPQDYRLQSFGDELDVLKFHRVMWRGFDNGDTPSPDFTFRRRMQSSPNYDPHLNIVVVAPGGDYAAYSGVWYDGVNQVAYIEPVATDPDYRRKGLAKAAVLECIRRVRKLGCKDVYVESAQAFYLGIGFQRIFGRYPWIREFDM